MEWGILTDRIKCYQVVTLPVRKEAGRTERGKLGREVLTMMIERSDSSKM